MSTPPSDNIRLRIWSGAEATPWRCENRKVVLAFYDLARPWILRSQRALDLIPSTYLSELAVHLAIPWHPRARIQCRACQQTSD